MLIKHFNWLKENGYNVISWQQVIDAENGKGTLPDNAVLLSFDDGYETMYNVVFPLLKAYNYPAVFAPVTGWLDTPANQKIPYADKMLDRSVFALGRKSKKWNKVDSWKLPHIPIIFITVLMLTHLVVNCPQ